MAYQISAKFRAVSKNLKRLKKYGVRILYQPETYPPKNHVPAEAILAELERIMTR
jgi:biotin operon repressor